VDGFIPWGAEHAARAFGGAHPVATMGYCMGGTMAAMYAARHPDKSGPLILLGTPIDFKRSGIMAKWTEPQNFDGDLLVDAFGNVPPWMLQSAFKALAMADIPRKYAELVKRADDDDAVCHFVALESWLEDNVAFPGGVYRQYIRDCYQHNRLLHGQMIVGGKAIDLRRITMPLLTVVARRDQICAPPSSLALMEVAGTRDKQVLEFDTGHIGLTTSRRSIAELWPRIVTWLVERVPAH
jgi:polyhydroxyalkanoate synthase